MKRAVALALLLAGVCAAGQGIHVPGLEKQVEVLRDRWGVPHIYAATVHDLFFVKATSLPETASFK